MGWKQAALFLSIVFAIVLAQTALAGPLITLRNELQAFTTAGNASTIADLFGSWFDMGLVAIFLLMGVTVAEVLRRELTRQGRL